MDRCYFAKEPPELELRGGLVFVMPVGAHCEIAITPHNLGKFVANANRVLDAFHDGGGRVLPFTGTGG